MSALSFKVLATGHVSSDQPLLLFSSLLTQALQETAVVICMNFSSLFLLLSSKRLIEHLLCTRCPSLCFR